MRQFWSMEVVLFCVLCRRAAANLMMGRKMETRGGIKAAVLLRYMSVMTVTSVTTVMIFNPALSA